MTDGERTGSMGRRRCPAGAGQLVADGRGGTDQSREPALPAEPGEVARWAGRGADFRTLRLLRLRANLS